MHKHSIVTVASGNKSHSWAFSKVAKEPKMLQREARRTMGNSERLTNSTEAANLMIKTWPARTRRAAKDLLKLLGPPTLLLESKLTWSDRGRWKAVTLYRDDSFLSAG
jgi:hypothetical protein